MSSNLGFLEICGLTCKKRDDKLWKYTNVCQKILFKYQCVTCLFKCLSFRDLEITELFLVEISKLNFVHFNNICVLKIAMSMDLFHSSILIFPCQGPLSPWLYGSWIYNYLCHLCLSPLMLWVQILFGVRCMTLCGKVCQWLVAGCMFSPQPIKLTAMI